MLFIIALRAVEVAKSLVKAPEGRVETPEQKWQAPLSWCQIPAKVAAWKFIPHEKAKQEILAVLWSDFSQFCSLLPPQA